MAWQPPPQQVYEYEIEQLVNEYKKAAVRLNSILIAADFDSMTAREQRRLLNEITTILRELDSAAGDWVDENIPKAYRDGQAAAVISIGEASTLIAAAELVSKNKLNRDFVAAMVADTMDDLLMMTRNTEVQVKRVVRQIVGEQLRANVIANEGSKAIERSVKERLRREINRAANFAIRDRANRIWSIEAYVDMVVRTKMMQAKLEGTINEAASRNVQYATISRHGSKHASCRRWEGRIVRLSDDAPGSYPTLSEVRASGGIFHPNCKHQVFPVRDVSLLPASYRRDN